jgi:electron transport complex protein RnfE
MGLGFAFALTCLGTVREVLGAGTFLGVPLFGKDFEPWVLFLLPPGGFIALAMWLLTFTLWRERKEKIRRQAQQAELRQALEVIL